MPETVAIEPPAAGATAAGPSIRLLTAHDSCDACGHQAFVLTTVTYIDHHGKPESADLAEMEMVEKERLLFCGHHYREFAEKIAELGWTVHDQTNRIN